MKRINMKWKYYFLLFCAFVLFGVSGCFGTRKTRTKVITETVIRLDTIIRVQTDTITIIKSVRLTDTVILENSTAKARSYYSLEKKRIVLELTGKRFDVPVSIYKSTKITSDIKEKVPVHTKVPYRRLAVWFAGALLLLFIYAYLTRKK